VPYRYPAGEPPVESFAFRVPDRRAGVVSGAMLVVMPSRCVRLLGDGEGTSRATVHAGGQPRAAPQLVGRVDRSVGEVTRM